MKHLKSLFVVVMLLIAISLISKVNAQSGTANFTVKNLSSWSIDYIYFSPTWDSYWGDDKLGTNVLEKNKEYKISLKEGCGDYDIKLIAKNGEECIIYDVYLCSETWEIYEEDLLDCEGY